MFVDLDWPLNASSLLSASAELLVNTRWDVVNFCVLLVHVYRRLTPLEKMRQNAQRKMMLKVRFYGFIKITVWSLRPRTHCLHCNWLFWSMILYCIFEQHIFNYLSEINVFNKLLSFFMVRYSLFVLKVPLNPKQLTSHWYFTNIVLATSRRRFYYNSQVHCMGAHSFLQSFELAMVEPNLY